MRRLLDVIERRPAMAAADGGATPAGVRGELALQGVAFAYPARPEHPVLKRRAQGRAWLRRGRTPSALTHYLPALPCPCGLGSTAAATHSLPWHESNSGSACLIAHRRLNTM